MRYPLDSDFFRWIALSTGKIAIKRISITGNNCMRYPMDSDLSGG